MGCSPKGLGVAPGAFSPYRTRVLHAAPILPGAGPSKRIQPMPPVQKTPPTPSAVELNATAEAERAKLAEKNDSDQGSNEENLVVVETKATPIEKYTHHKVRLSDARIATTSHLDLLSIGYDRGYWSKGIAGKSRAEVRELFTAAQAKDDTLHDEPQR